MKAMTYTRQDGTVAEYHYDMDSGSVWHTHDPGHQCAMWCDREGVIPQVRQTGPNHKAQTWWFCQECWERYYGTGAGPSAGEIVRRPVRNFDLVGRRGEKCL